MKIGIDIHGVADKKRKFFAILSQRAIENGHEVHVITGNQRTPEIEKELEEYNIQYTHFFGVADYLIQKGCKVEWATPNDPFFDDKDWNPSKANYCKEQGIDIHFDDSLEYKKYFTTLFVRVI